MVGTATALTPRSYEQFRVFSCMHSDHGEELDAARRLLNRVLYTDLGLSPKISTSTDEGISAAYAIATHQDRVIGAGRVGLRTSPEVVVRSGLVEKLRTEQDSLSPEILAPVVGDNFGLVVTEDYRRGNEYNFHVGSALHDERERISRNAGKKYLVMQSRPVAWNLAERQGFFLLQESVFEIAAGKHMTRRWYFKEL